MGAADGEHVFPLSHRFREGLRRLAGRSFVGMLERDDIVCR